MKTKKEKQIINIKNHNRKLCNRYFVEICTKFKASKNEIVEINSKGQLITDAKVIDIKKTKLNKLNDWLCLIAKARDIEDYSKKLGLSSYKEELEQHIVLFKIVERHKRLENFVDY